MSEKIPKKMGEYTAYKKALEAVEKMNSDDIFFESIEFKDECILTEEMQKYLFSIVSKEALH